MKKNSERMKVFLRFAGGFGTSATTGGFGLLGLRFRFGFCSAGGGGGGGGGGGVSTTGFTGFFLAADLMTTGSFRQDSGVIKPEPDESCAGSCRRTCFNR